MQVRDDARRWLSLNDADAVWLSTVASTVEAAAGSRVGGPDLAHVVLTGMDRGRIVEAGGRHLVLRQTAQLLVLPPAALDELRRRTVVLDLLAAVD